MLSVVNAKTLQNTTANPSNDLLDKLEGHGVGASLDPIFGHSNGINVTRFQQVIYNNDQRS